MKEKPGPLVKRMRSTCKSGSGSRFSSSWSRSAGSINQVLVGGLAERKCIGAELRLRYSRDNRIMLLTAVMFDFLERVDHDRQQANDTQTC